MKKQKILEKVESFLPQQFSKRGVEEMWSRTVCNCLWQDYSPHGWDCQIWGPGQDGCSLQLVRTIPASRGTFDGSARGEAAFRTPTGKDTAPAELLSPKPTTQELVQEKMFLFGAYHQSGRELNGKILPSALQQTPYKHCHKNSPSNPLGFNVMKTCQKCFGAITPLFVYYLLCKCVHQGVDVCDWIFRLCSSFRKMPLC